MAWLELQITYRPTRAVDGADDRDAPRADGCFILVLKGFQLFKNKIEVMIVRNGVPRPPRLRESSTNNIRRWPQAGTGDSPLAAQAGTGRD